MYIDYVYIDYVYIYYIYTTYTKTRKKNRAKICPETERQEQKTQTEPKTASETAQTANRKQVSLYIYI
jgi:hypothetical protein